MILYGLIRETDCLDCLEKLLCGWDDLVEKTKIPGVNRGERLLFVSEEGESFDPEQLAELCGTPANFRPISKTLADQPIYADVTPAVFLVLNNRVVYQQPIFVNMELRPIREKVVEVVEELYALGRIEVTE